MEALICLSVFIVVSSIWAYYTTKNRRWRNQNDRVDVRRLQPIRSKTHDKQQQLDHLIPILIINHSLI